MGYYYSSFTLALLLVARLKSINKCISKTQSTTKPPAGAGEHTNPSLKRRSVWGSSVRPTRRVWTMPTHLAGLLRCHQAKRSNTCTRLAAWKTRHGGPPMSGLPRCQPRTCIRSLRWRAAHVGSSTLPAAYMYSIASLGGSEGARPDVRDQIQGFTMGRRPALAWLRLDGSTSMPSWLVL
ncbi:hypothetical protein PF008_g10883 [Phytophthora fragariae]|uniref:Secreted protein n=1 Tax=Phytophthora fragariae TaxID=53985 RepID=A0A6G0RSI7_9STRA|nr:hypothetical protein PF008_g10883 [Phytophthora fragariae]